MSADDDSLADVDKPTRRAALPPVPRVCQAVALAVFAWLMLYVTWPYAERFGADVLARKEWLPAESFARMDPLVGVLAALAARRAGVALACAVGVLVLCLFVPRFFCSHVCPLGTLIDLFDWAIGGRVRRIWLERRGAWVHTRFYVLTAVLAAALVGVQLSGHVAALPVVTRGVAFLIGPAQVAVLKHPGLVRPVGWEYFLSVVLFVVVIGLGLLGRRLWCRCICPSGALLSLASLLRLRERRVTHACVQCGKCARACPFDAVRGDFTTRPLDCTFCRTCARVCPTGAVVFGKRVSLSTGAAADNGERVSRRGFVAAAAVGAACVALPTKAAPLRPPGAVDEREFLRLCVRCGACMKACPGPVLHPAGLEAGVAGMWTPVAVPSWSGCHPDCNFCGQVCPTGAIQALPIEQKRRAKMGLASVDKTICLPHTGERDCQLCLETCRDAGYHAIKMQEIRLEVGDVPPGVLTEEELAEAGRILAPVVDAQACVGCGLCENRCGTLRAKREGLIPRSAIRVEPL